MSIYLKDIVYDDIREVTPVAAVSKGDVAQVQDVIGFYLYDVAANTEVTFITKAKQALADKSTGSGEEINSGDKVYLNLTTGKVSATKGAGMLYCGTAKETVDGDATQVLIEFDGTIPNDIT